MNGSWKIQISKSFFSTTSSMIFLLSGHKIILNLRKNYESRKVVEGRSAFEKLREKHGI
jgi:hypothetical protein